ncbi:MAG TPA: protein-disulfide reductase DsbD N-terminal domain-containing protein, partial [Gallionella sp.]|nr:protein-disulfide reductase DsbD N-terminal domain-containing protein [Gallionella sp.]
MRSLLLALLLIVAPAAHAGFLDSLGGAKQPAFLPPDQAFSLQVTVRDADTLQANFNLAEGYYLYRDKIAFTSKDVGVKIKAVSLPRGEMKQDPSFGEVEVFHRSFQAEIELERVAKGAASIALDAAYMGCSEQGLCYPPINKTLTVALPDAGTGLREPALTEAPPPS